MTQTSEKLFFQRKKIHVNQYGFISNLMPNDKLCQVYDPPYVASLPMAI